MRFFPLINDITSDFEYPPLLYRVEKGIVLDETIVYDQRFREPQKKFYPEIIPLVIEGHSHETIFQLILSSALQQKNWKIVSQRSPRLQIVAVTPIFRFKDDMALELRSVGGRLLLHARSRSRMGRGDFGKNAKRIQDFFHRVEEDINAI